MKKKIFCVFLACLMLVCSVMFVACDQCDQVNADNTNKDSQQEKDEIDGCVVNGIKYEILNASAVLKSRYPHEYEMAVRLVLTNFNDVAYMSETNIFKLTASNNIDAEGGDKAPFGELTVFFPQEKGTIVIPAKSNISVDLIFSVGSFSLGDWVRVFHDRDGNIVEYSESNDPDQSNEFIISTDFNIYVGNTLISDLDIVDIYIYAEE